MLLNLPSKHSKLEKLCIIFMPIGLTIEIIELFSKFGWHKDNGHCFYVRSTKERKDKKLDSNVMSFFMWCVRGLSCDDRFSAETTNICYATATASLSFF